MRNALLVRSAFVALLTVTGCANPHWARSTSEPPSYPNGVEHAESVPPSDSTVVRYQQSTGAPTPSSIYQDYQDAPYEPTAGADDLPRQRMPVSGSAAVPANGASPLPAYVTDTRGTVQQAQFTAPPPPAGPPVGGVPYGSPFPAPPPTVVPPSWTGGPMAAPQAAGNSPVYTTQPYTTLPPPPGMSDPVFGPNDRFADVIVNLQEARTGRLIIGAAVTSDAGITGQIIVDERNFDWREVPHSWDDIWSGRAFRGAGQGFRLEALPGNQFQRYAVSFSEPFLLDTRVSLDLSGFLFDRNYFDWDEGRIGGHAGLGYRITPDLSVSMRFRGEEVELSDPRVPGVPELEAALGKNDIYGTRFAIAHDTRDMPFFPSQGRFLELSYEQVFGDFDYPRGMLDWRRYFLVTERADGSGRHVLGFSNRVGLTGSQTPIFDNFFAGGYSTLRGFNLRGASPQDMGVVVGGELMLLGSVEYIFPVTADDMLKGVAFVDYGTVEEEMEIDWDDYRVAVGAGVRITIPAMGSAPIAIDFAVPIAREVTDNIQNVSFSMGFTR